MRWIKAFFKSFGILLAVDFAAWLLSLFVYHAVLGWTPLGEMRNEDMRIIVADGVMLGVFLMTMLIKPLADLHKYQHAESEKDLKDTYIRNTAAMCVAYTVYSFLANFTPLYLIDFFGAHFYFYFDVCTYFLEILFYSGVAFFAIQLGMNGLMYREAKRHMQEEEARFYAGMPKDSEE